MTPELIARIEAVCNDIGWPEWKDREQPRQLYPFSTKLNNREQWLKRWWHSAGGEWLSHSGSFDEHTALCLLEHHFREKLVEAGVEVINTGRGEFYVHQNRINAAWLQGHLGMFDDYLIAQLAALEALTAERKKSNG